MDTVAIWNEIIQSFKTLTYSQNSDIDNAKILQQMNEEIEYVQITVPKKEIVSETVSGQTDVALNSIEKASMVNTNSPSSSITYKPEWCIFQWDGINYRRVCWLAASATTLNLRFSEKWITGLRAMADRAFDEEDGFDLFDEETYPEVIKTTTVADIINSCIYTKYTGKSYKIGSWYIARNINKKFPVVLYLRGEKALVIESVHCITAYAFSDGGNVIFAYDPLQEKSVSLERENPVIYEKYYNENYTWTETISYK